MNELKIHKKTIKFPSAWDELTNEQLLFLASLIPDRNIDDLDIMVKMFLYCTGIQVVDAIYDVQQKERVTIIEIDGLRVEVKSHVIWDACMSMGWLFEDRQLTPRFTRNPFPTIETDRMTLKGPDDGLTNISFGQYCMAMVHAEVMGIDFEEHINPFMALLWKDLQFEPIELGDPGWFDDVSREMKMVCCFWFIGCVNFLKKRFPLTFGSEGYKDTSASTFDMQQRLIDEMAGGDITKKEQVRNAPLYDALYTIELAMERKKKQQHQQSHI